MTDAERARYIANARVFRTEFRALAITKIAAALAEVRAAEQQGMAEVRVVILYWRRFEES